MCGGYWWACLAQDVGARIFTWNVTGKEQGIVELISSWFG